MYTNPSPFKIKPKPNQHTQNQITPLPPPQNQGPPERPAPRSPQKNPSPPAGTAASALYLLGLRQDFAPSSVARHKVLEYPGKGPWPV